jgi:phenylpropionate dioxygenase-like ring-hydroxylating dioxygenase large terminal subunit
MTSFARHPAIRRSWQAVLRSADLTDAPKAVRVCGDDVVVWRDGSGKVTATPDRCPHREALLSNGAIVDGLLECPYHGWSFDGDGRCVYIPSSGRGAPIPSKAHLGCISVQERYGLVWLALEPPTQDLPDIVQDRDPTFRRHVEPLDLWRVAATRMVDNFCDVAHFAWVHTGTFGTGIDPAVQPVALEQLDEDFYGWRYAVEVANTGQGTVTTGQAAPTVERLMTTGFALPLLVRSTIMYPATGLTHVILLVSTPVDDEHSLFTFLIWRNDDFAVPLDEVITFDRMIGAEDKRMLETVPGTLALTNLGLVSTQADRASVEWRRRLHDLLEATDRR